MGSKNTRKFKFTKPGIEALPANPREAKAREAEYSDSLVTGLRVLVSKNGRKFFHFRYCVNKRKRIIVIGEFPAVSVQEARERALEFRNQLSRSLDPHAEKQKSKAVPTFAEFVEKEYMPFAKQNKKSWQDDANKLKADMIPIFGDIPLSAITTREIQKYITKISERTTSSTANRHLSLLSRMFTLAVQWQILPESPCRFIKKAKESGGLERFLTDEEISKFQAALDEIGNGVSTLAIRFLLSTGLRLSEALTLKWAHFDLKGKKLKLLETKAGKARTVILNALAVEILNQVSEFKENEWVFPGSGPKGHMTCLKRPFQRAKEIAGIDNCRLHDLRHTFASLAINNGATLYEVQKLLGHHSSQMTQRYAHLSDSSLKSATEGVAQRIIEKCESGSN